jgi:hypothetical protein
MKIGFVVSFFDFRNDVRKVIEALLPANEVIVFYKPSDEKNILTHKITGVVYRPILERNGSLKNKIAEQLFLYFKKIPKSRNNYFLMELFKISNTKSARAVRKGKFILKMQQLLPRLVSYDQLLKWLTPSCKTEISDVERFIFFTEIADDFLLSRLLKERKDIVTYVYSWDHPCKHTRFSKLIKYCCWSNGIKEDIQQLQGIDPASITVVGASQFGYLFDFLHAANDQQVRAYPFEYIYFGCAVGIKELVPQEINVIKQLAKLTYDENPSLKIVVRPYPVLDQWSLYDALKNLPNVLLDDSFRKKDLSISDNDIFSKFEKIAQAKAFLHLGTTLGLESCFTGTPSFIIDFGYESKDGLSLYSFIHQYQNDKYLGLPSDKNTISDLEEYRIFLNTPDPKEFLKINHFVQDEFKLQSFSSFGQQLISN